MVKELLNKQIYLLFSESLIRDFCDIINKTEGPSVHLQYGFSSLVSSKRNCKCKASTTSGTLQIQAVDIRFQNGSSGICGENQNSYLELDSANHSIKCKYNQLIGGYETIFNSTKSSMDLLLHLDGGRPTVWIAILATSERNVSVVCNNIDIDTTLSYGSSYSEGINLTTSANFNEINPTTFTLSKIVNLTTFTNSEKVDLETSTYSKVIKQTTTPHSEQTSTNPNIQPTDVTKYPKIAASVFTMKEKVDLETSAYSEVMNQTTAPHPEQTRTNHNIQPTDVTKYPKKTESVYRMKGTVDVCYGKRRIVQCEAKYKISIRDISYERNCTSSCLCTYSRQRQCAEFRLPGSWINYRYYDAVYGLQENFIVESLIRDFCDIINKTEGPSVHLQYGFSSLISSKRNCKCKASTTSGTLQIQAVDIRFQNGSSGICGENQNSYLELDSANHFIKCKYNQLIGGYETIFNSTNSSMDLLLHLDGGRPTVWIAIQATSGRNVSVVCDNFDIDTTLAYGLTSTYSESINLTTSANLKETNPTTFTNSKIVNPTTFTNSEVINQTTASHLEQRSTNHNFQPTDVTKCHKTADSVSRMKDGKIDPAIIVLVLTGSLTLVLIVIGIVIGRVKYVNKSTGEYFVVFGLHYKYDIPFTQGEFESSANLGNDYITIIREKIPASFADENLSMVRNKLDRIHSEYSQERKTIAKENTYIHTNPNQELEKSQSPTSRSEHITSPTIKEEQTSYSEVQKKRRSDPISDNYDHLNNKGSFKSEENSYIHNKTGTYDHCQSIVHSSDWHYDKVEVNNSGISSNSHQRNILLYPRDDTPSKLESDANFDEQNISPYVDEAVINGMKDAYRLRSLSSSIDVDESIRDMMTNATSWAEEDSL
ncbi:unnamed protein product [Mytilus coruscus]|uniref:Uncharacterized protein n=1 Tax=Mytilus coruscus TaxID=42192 RepID=A0A6J8BZ06_MYTCO|nr:unnamed protein product [Mytilus coruscus]